MRATTGAVLAFDVGNTSVKIARLAAEGTRVLARVPASPLSDLDVRLREALEQAHGGAVTVSRCVVGSVSPPASAAVRGACGAMGLPAEFFRTDIPIPLPTKLLEPDRVGMDRLLLGLGARHRCGSPCICVSAGTAITVDLIDPDGAFAGGAIMPGLRLAARALNEHTEFLPSVEPDVPESDVGRDTSEAIRSGVYWACAGGAAALVGRYRSLPGCSRAPVILTGTDAELLAAKLGDRIDYRAPDVIFTGMAVALGLMSETGRLRTQSRP